MLGVDQLVFSDALQGHVTHSNQIYGASHGPQLKPSKGQPETPNLYHSLKGPCVPSFWSLNLSSTFSLLRVYTFSYSSMERETRSSSDSLQGSTFP